MSARPPVTTPARYGGIAPTPRSNGVVKALAWMLALVVAAGVLLLGGAVAWVWTSARTSTVGTLGFERPLAIPPLLEPRVEADGTKVFDLRAQAGTAELVAGRRTATWGLNGAHLGPTLRATRGDRVRVHLTNGLPEATTMHWHGMHLPAAADGGPHQPIQPGTTWSPSWRIEQPAATLWYHPHPHQRTQEHVYRGLAGMFILDDPEAAELALPRRYGVDDIPLIVQDKRIKDSGELDFGQAFFSPVGRLGDTILVNGTSDPHLEVTSQRVRLRLLNAAAARVFTFGFADDRPFDLIGTDGGLLTAPHRTDRVRLSPGERAEIVVQLTPGERVVLRSFPTGLDAGPVDRFAGGHDSFDILELRAADRLEPSPPVPDRLAPEPPPASEVRWARERDFGLDDEQTINGRSMDMGRIDAAVDRGTTELWRVRNRGGLPHNFHVHGVTFRVLDADGDPPPPDLAGWKDTVLVLPGKELRLLVTFTNHTDPATPYMFHCHLLAHEDGGMMGQFVVVEPGRAPAGPPAHEHP